MGVLQRLVTAPYRFIIAPGEIDQWIEEILRAAVIKHSRQVVIRKTKDKLSLEALVHDCGSDDCAVRMRQIDAELHEDALISTLKNRLSLKPMSHQKTLRYGRYEDFVMERHLSITVLPPRLGEPLSVTLLIAYR